MGNQSVDVVISFETIEHHDQHHEMMREVRRILRPGGVLVISSPDRREYSEVPAHENPFHLRELYRDEFEGLLKSHFRHVSLVGQRVKAGSIVGPLGTPANTEFISFENADKVDRRIEGLDAPLYFIAAATDGPMPRLSTGLLDGGEFLWSSDHLEAVRAMREALTQAGTVHEATASVLRAELDRHMTTITQLSDEKGRLEERSAQLQGQSNQAHVALEEARAQLRTARDTIASREAALRQFEQRGARQDGRTRAPEKNGRSRE